jgi:hypothetical protein
LASGSSATKPICVRRVPLGGVVLSLCSLSAESVLAEFGAESLVDVSQPLPPSKVPHSDPGSTWRQDDCPRAMRSTRSIVDNLGREHRGPTSVDAGCRVPTTIDMPVPCAAAAASRRRYVRAFGTRAGAGFSPDEWRLRCRGRRCQTRASSCGGPTEASVSGASGEEDELASWPVRRVADPCQLESLCDQRGFDLGSIAKAQGRH